MKVVTMYFGPFAPHYNKGLMLKGTVYFHRHGAWRVLRAGRDPRLLVKKPKLVPALYTLLYIDASSWISGCESPEAIHYAD
jgi:hypothetical protein